MLKINLYTLLTLLLIMFVTGIGGIAHCAKLKPLFFIKPATNQKSYVGDINCRICHIKQYKAWRKTSMAASFENLKPGIRAEDKKKAGIDPDKDYTADPNCLKCHTTGYGKPDGFISLAETPKLINVQCEGCHGAGAVYWKIMRDRNFKLADARAAGLIIPDEEEKNCLECHGDDSPFNEKVDPKYKFDFKESLEKSHEHFPLIFEH